MNKHQKNFTAKNEIKTSTVATIENQSLEEKAKATEEGEISNREIRCSQIYLTFVLYIILAITKLVSK